MHFTGRMKRQRRRATFPHVTAYFLRTRASNDEIKKGRAVLVRRNAVFCWIGRFQGDDFGNDPTALHLAKKRPRRELLHQSSTPFRPEPRIPRCRGE